MTKRRARNYPLFEERVGISEGDLRNAQAWQEFIQDGWRCHQRGMVAQDHVVSAMACNAKYRVAKADLRCIRAVP